MQAEPIDWISERETWSARGAAPQITTGVVTVILPVLVVAPAIVRCGQRAGTIGDTPRERRLINA